MTSRIVELRNALTCWVGGSKELTLAELRDTILELDQLLQQHESVLPPRRLNDQRRLVADGAFEAFDFGVLEADATVVDSNGWEILEDRWRRTVFLQTAPSEASRNATFTVEFYPLQLHIKEAAAGFVNVPTTDELVAR